MKILLVRLRLIGDVVFTTPLISALRRRYPDAEITYVVEPSAAPVVLGNPHLTRTLTIPRSSGLDRILGDLALARQVRRQHFDVAIDLHGGPRSAWLAWASGAQMRIGYRIPGRTWMYTHVIERPPDNGPRHSVLNQWDLLAPLDVAPASPQNDPVQMASDPDADARVAAYLSRADIAPDAPIVVVHVSAGNPFRRWPAESFIAAIEDLARRNPARRVLVTSGPSEATAAAAIITEARQRLGPLANAVPSIPDLDLLELRALIARSALYVGGDSGPLHIASTTTVPIVALLGPTLPERSQPWRRSTLFSECVDGGALPCRPCRQRICEPGDFRCLTRVTPAMVVEAGERALAWRGDRG